MMLLHWTLLAPTVHFDLTKFKKDTTNLETYSFICNLFQNILYQKKKFTDVSKMEGVAAAAVSTKQIHNSFTCWLPKW